MMLHAPQFCSSTTELIPEGTDTNCLIRVFIMMYENIHLQPILSVYGIVYQLTL